MEKRIHHCGTRLLLILQIKDLRPKSICWPYEERKEERERRENRKRKKNERERGKDGKTNPSLWGQALAYFANQGPKTEEHLLA